MGGFGEFDALFDHVPPADDDGVGHVDLLADGAELVGDLEGQLPCRR